MLNLNGNLYYVPGVYGTIEVIVLGSVTLPTFTNLLIVGGAKKGLPTTAAGRKGYQVIQSFDALSDVQNFYGVSDLSKAAAYAKQGGAGVIFFANVAPLTQASATIKDNAGTPANTIDLSAADPFWGAPGNDTSITIAAASNLITFTIIPSKLTKFLTANASTTSPIVSLADVGGLYAGQSISIWDNSASAPQSTSILLVDSTNNQITLANNPTSAYATSGFARIFVEDTANQQVKTFDNTANTVQDVINWINSSSILVAARNTYTGLIPTTLTKTFFGALSGATKGTSPTATDTSSGDYDNFATSAPKFLEEFTNYTGVRLRIINVLSSSASEHAVYNTLATTLRGNQYSIQVVGGVALGDINASLSASNHPIQRAKSLNSADFILVGMGQDGIAANLSSASLVAGMLSANSVKHNLSGDVITATTLEKTFGDFNKNTETVNYVNNGVIIFETGRNGFYLIQGLNTFQNHNNIWDSSSNKSYLIQQMQIVDYVYEGYKNQMSVGVGADDYGPTVATAQGNAILQQYQNEGYITSFSILKAYQEQNAVITEPQIQPVSATDFVGFVLKVVIPE